MTTTTGDAGGGRDGSPPAPVLLLIGSAVVVGAGVLLVMYALAGAADRHQIIEWLPGIGGGLLVSIPAVLAWLRGEQVHQVATRIEQATNGSLDTRMRQAVRTALDERVVSTVLPGASSAVDEDAPPQPPTPPDQPPAQPLAQDGVS